jgi:hypothetical protein
MTIGQVVDITISSIFIWLAMLNMGLLLFRLKPSRYLAQILFSTALLSYLGVC